LWHEGFGLVVVEAMLRGIPVVSSDAGGLREAKCGTGYVVPLRTIESYQPVFDEQAMPRPVLPVNHLAPWLEALAELLGDRTAWERESAASRAAAAAFVAGIDSGAMESWLLALQPFSDARAKPATIESLTPGKRALLLRRLHRRNMCTEK
jgi:glycosyltransferase involved in cell wall biosynthesis